MKLSEAMRRGSKMTHQTIGRWTDDNGGGCALVATMLGCGIITRPHNAFFFTGTLFATFPELFVMRNCPACDIPPYETGKLIMHLNDVHSWTTERIAGFIESHIETPTYSMLQIQEYMGEPVMTRELAEIRR